MSRRIEVELTSDRGDGTWTWRAAGAKKPKGVLGADLLYPGAKVGDVVRAEADFDVDGITVLSVQAPRSARSEPERLEIIGPARPFEPVISNVTGRDRDDDDRPRRRRRDDAGGGPVRGDRPRGDRPDRGDRRPARSGPGDRRPPRAERPDRPPRERPAPPPPKPKAKKLRPGRMHRDALLESLPPEQQSVGEQVLRGGMPGVRAALEEQNSAARASGQPEVPAEPLLAMAEAVLPRARVAEWLDRAEAALADADELALRDLRSVVVSADDVARDEATRPLAAQLREVLERRTAAEQEEWLTDLASSLEGGRVVRALRLSSRPPEPTSTLPAELSARLAEAAGAAMTADIAPDRWATVLDAVAYSPVRRSVTPAGVPAEPGDELLTAVRKHAGRAPAIASLFGIAAPAPTGSSGAGRRSRPARGAGRSRSAPVTASAAAGAGGAGAAPLPPGVRRIPPPPPAMLGGRPIPPPPGPHRPAVHVPPPEGEVGPTLPPAPAGQAPTPVDVSDAPAAALPEAEAVAPAPVRDSAAPTQPDAEATRDAMGATSASEPYGQAAPVADTRAVGTEADVVEPFGQAAPEGDTAAAPTEPEVVAAVESAIEAAPEAANSHAGAPPSEPQPDAEATREATGATSASEPYAESAPVGDSGSVPSEPDVVAAVESATAATAAPVGDTGATPTEPDVVAAVECATEAAPAAEPFGDAGAAGDTGAGFSEPDVVAAVESATEATPAPAGDTGAPPTDAQPDVEAAPVGDTGATPTEPDVVAAVESATEAAPAAEPFGDAEAADKNEPEG